MESHHLESYANKVIYLMSSDENLKARNVRAVLWYHVPNINKNAEEYANHLLFSLYLFRNKDNLKHPPFSEKYLAKL